MPGIFAQSGSGCLLPQLLHITTTVTGHCEADVVKLSSPSDAAATRAVVRGTSATSARRAGRAPARNFIRLEKQVKAPPSPDIEHQKNVPAHTRSSHSTSIFWMMASHGKKTFRSTVLSMALRLAFISSATSHRSTGALPSGSPGPCFWATPPVAT